MTIHLVYSSVTGNSPYSRPCLLSPELSQIMGKDKVRFAVISKGNIYIEMKTNVFCLTCITLASLWLHVKVV